MNKIKEDTPLVQIGLRILNKNIFFINEILAETFRTAINLDSFFLILKS